MMGCVNDPSMTKTAEYLALSLRRHTTSLFRRLGRRTGSIRGHSPATFIRD